MMKLTAAVCNVIVRKSRINDGELRFNFWFRWGISLLQHVYDSLGPSESSTTWYSGLFCVGVRINVPTAKKLHLCSAKFKNVVSFTVTVLHLALR